MAIGTDALIDVFGTLDGLDDGATGSVTDGSFSADGDVAEWTNDDDAPEGAVDLVWQYASGTLDSNAHIIVRYALAEVVSTHDEPVVDSGFPGHVFGVIFVDTNASTATDQHHRIRGPLQNGETSQKYRFYIENKTGVTISANWDMEITPVTQGPHA